MDVKRPLAPGSSVDADPGRNCLGLGRISTSSWKIRATWVCGCTPGRRSGGQHKSAASGPARSAIRPGVHVTGDVGENRVGAFPDRLVVLAADPATAPPAPPAELLNNLPAAAVLLRLQPYFPR